MAGYYGMKNRQTYDVSLWLDTDYGTYCTCRQLAVLSEGNKVMLADLIEQLVHDMMPEEMQKCNMFSDLLQHALSEVDWIEVANRYLEQ